MMVLTSEYDASSDSGIRHASESLRSIVFIKEHDNGSYSSIDVSDPFCETHPYVNADYAGSIVEISTQYTQLELVVSANSRMNGTLGFTGFCPTGNCVDNRKSSRIVDMIKVAPLPIGNWRHNFEDEAPTIGHISGIVQPDQPRDATSDALEFDDNVTCFMQSKGTGGHDFFVTPINVVKTKEVPDYESIVVSTNEKDFIAGRYNDVLGYWGASVNERRPTQSTKKFKMNVAGTNPITANISADASNDASSDGAEIDINIDF